MTAVGCYRHPEGLIPFFVAFLSLPLLHTAAVLQYTVLLLFFLLLFLLFFLFLFFLFFLFLLDRPSAEFFRHLLEAVVAATPTPMLR